MPTRHKEGVPYAILEAFKFGLPVISSKVGAIPEMIIHGRNGFMVNSTDVQDIADKMMSLCKQETIYEMGQKAKEFVRLNFSIRSLEKKLEEYYLS